MSTQAQPASQAGQAEQPIWPGLTVEAVLYAALLAGAALMRFFDLGRWALLSDEAHQALAAWRFLHGQGAAGGTVPFLFNGALAGLFAFGASDAVVRVVPALLGTALVLLPLALRPRLGRWGALAAGFLLAFSPSLVFFSRTLAGAVPALAGLAGVLWGVELARRGQMQRAKVAGGVGLAVALTSSPWVYSFLLAALLFFGLGRLASRQGKLWPGWIAGERALRPLLGDGKAWGFLALLLAPFSTALLLNLSGLQGVADLLGTWLSRLVPGSGGASWLYPLGTLAFYELGALVLGLAGLVVGIRQQRPWAGFLGGWVAVALLLATASGAREAEPVAFAVVPLSLLSGLAVSEVVARLKAPQWMWVGICLFLLSAVLGFWWLELAAYSGAYPDVALRVDLRLVGLLVLLMPLFLVGALVVFWRLVGRTETAWTIAILGLGLFAVLLVRHSVGLNFACARDPREPLVVAPSSVDLKDMAAFLEEWSVRKAGDQHVLSVAVQSDLDPLVPWYLRDFADLRLLPAPVGTDALALVLSSEPGRPKPSGYMGQRYRLRTHADVPLGEGRQGLAWWLLRRGGGEVRAETCELWIKP